MICRRSHNISPSLRNESPRDVEVPTEGIKEILTMLFSVLSVFSVFSVASVVNSLPDSHGKMTDALLPVIRISFRPMMSQCPNPS